VESEGLTEHVTFLDETLDVRPFYQASDVLVLPSHYEGQGLVILEAAFCARPALISEAVNRAYLVKDGETGWVTPADDATQMAETLVQVLNTPRADRDRMGAAARDYLLPQYRAEVMAERYLSLYNHLIESKKR
jgi:glycosyltransferase involved in cell wall biosynthesis